MNRRAVAFPGTRLRLRYAVEAVHLIARESGHIPMGVGQEVWNHDRRWP